jgi:hypothetical protein
VVDLSMSRHARHMVAIWSIDHLLTLTVAAVYNLKRPEVEEDRRRGLLHLRLALGGNGPRNAMAGARASTPDMHGTCLRTYHFSLLPSCKEVEMQSASRIPPIHHLQPGRPLIQLVPGRRRASRVTSHITSRSALRPEPLASQIRTGFDPVSFASTANASPCKRCSEVPARRPHSVLSSTLITSELFARTSGLYDHDLSGFECDVRPRS